MVKEDVSCQCHHHGKGTMMLVLGLLVLANAYWNVLDWAMFIGLVLAVGGLAKMLMPKK